MEEGSQVEQVRGIVGALLTTDQIVRLLKIFNNDVGTAVDKYFDNPDVVNKPIPNEGWDEGAWKADRYGSSDTGAGSAPSAFNIYPHSGAASLAPSRPPSRISHHSALSPATPLQSIEQESGTVGNTHFGPANKDHYDTSSWSMVPVSTAASIVPDITAASQRKREEGGPAIIKPVPSGDYLPALLTILHSIPIFRNALLTPQVNHPEYDAGAEWWKGNPVSKARIIDRASGDDATSDQELIGEVQRLMAFLDGTDRAYGSIEPLRELYSASSSTSSLDSTHKEVVEFLLKWGAAYQHQTGFELNGKLRSMVRLPNESHESFMLDANVIGDSAGNKTLYDVLDDTLFLNESTKAHIVDISSVLILKLSNAKIDNTTLDCKIPATFYADRYLEENKDAIDTMFQDMKQYQTQLKQVDSELSKLKYNTGKKARPGEQVETLKILKTSMAAFQPKEDDLIEDPNNNEVIAQLQSVYHSIEQKLNILENRKKQAQEMLDGVSARFKAPFDDGTGSAMDTSDDATATVQTTSPPQFSHPYKLVGVSTRSNVYYLLHPDVTSPSTDAKPWWRIEYMFADMDPIITREKLSLSSVIERASTEYGSALLIYANEAATAEPLAPLSETLQRFVTDDNTRFEKEVQDEQSGPVWDNSDWNTSTWENPGLESLAGATHNGNNDRVQFSNNASTDHAAEWAHYGGSSNNTYNDTALHSSAVHDGFDNNADFDFSRTHGDDDEGMSSTTLTPNTDFEDQEPVEATEMVEVNGGIGAWAGMSDTGSSSSSTAGFAQGTTGAGHDPGAVNVDLMDLDGAWSSKDGTEHREVVGGETKKGVDS